MTKRTFIMYIFMAFLAIIAIYQFVLSDSDAKVEDDKSGLIFENYEKLLANEPTPFEIIDYLNINLDVVDKAAADIMIIRTIDYNKDYMDQDEAADLYALLDEHYGIEVYFKIDDLNNLKELDDDTLAIMTKYKNGGYKLAEDEVTYWLELDYKFYIDSYSKYLSPELQDYLAIISLPTIVESNKLIATWDELANQIILNENYITSYEESNFYKIDEYLKLANSNYQSYLRYYIIGIESTKPYDITTNIVKSEVLTSYNNIINHYPTSKLAATLTIYLNKLKTTNNVFTDTISLEMNDLLK